MTCSLRYGQVVLCFCWFKRVTICSRSSLATLPR